MTNHIIHKQSLTDARGFKLELELPYNATILSLQLQNGIPIIWYMFPRYAELGEKFEVHVYGTGWDTEIIGKYIGTVQMYGYVWHLFLEKI